MPKPCLMTWVASHARWMKWYKGKSYAVSCRQLGTPPIKVASMEAANNWWRAKQNEIDHTLPKHPPEVLAQYETATRNATTYRDLAILKHDPFEAARHQAHLDWLLSQLRKTPKFPLSKWEEDAYWQETNPTLEHVQVNNTGLQTWVVWHERKKHLAEVKKLQQEQNKPVEHSPSEELKQFLAEKMSEVQNGQLSASRYDALNRYLTDFVQWCNTKGVKDVKDITEKVMSDAKNWCGQAKPSVGRDKLIACKQFVKWLYVNHRLELPRNLEELSLPTTLKASPTFTKEQIQAILTSACPRLKLSVLLALNCGMYQGDIGALTQEQVDWENGTITRCREKTKLQPNATVVQYQLWQPTFELLRQLRSKDTPLVLLNNKGMPLVNVYLGEDGKRKNYDDIGYDWDRLADKLLLKGTFKHLRKLPARLLEGNKDFKDYQDVFLNRTVKSITEKFYLNTPHGDFVVNYSQTRFNDALAWVGNELGLVTS